MAPCWKSEIFFRERDSIFMKILPFGLVCKDSCGSHEQTHSIVNDNLKYFFSSWRCNKYTKIESVGKKLPVAPHSTLLYFAYK